MSALNQQVLQNLDESSKKEILEFIEAENSKSKVQTSIHQFTDLCFKKCVSNIGNGQLSNQEESCLSNCVNRFLDTNIKVVQGCVSLSVALRSMIATNKSTSLQAAQQ
jgi:import inner membrane translocase subunit TIM8